MAGFPPATLTARYEPQSGEREPDIMEESSQMPPESHQKAADEMARTTKPGGHVIVAVAKKPTR